ncbi:hypothetical protein DUNSADRAFT_7729 [Dunaliella salina]|uniref:Encoded protein n=1 Tax=Dunaliella salina TaxID=3046 RepID=A0ABQ7GKW6_DUNSA|nr:hypothetical protein DUNSADRAFT_7729 [Dunaliella salina]KAF5835241.1 hypothetical protein DUNSADRAFT_7729 [Dunaliella salina]|eukprot:KAF5835240.1 hypothetical protein DUNSADRAFT_7729 [Dunaliella salina]
MQRKPITDRERREGMKDTSDVPLVVEQTPVWTKTPFMLMVMIVVLGAVYCGRGEVWNAYIGAKAYVSQSIIGRASTALRLQGPPTATAAAPTHVPPITKQKVTLPDSKEFEVWDEPIPESCNAEPNTDYDGTPDIHTHHTGSCWLKYRETPKVNSKGDFPPAFRAEHKTAPLKVPQVSGVLNKPASPSA